MAYDLVVVGCSLGGMQALKILLGALAASFPLAVAVAQHRGVDRAGDLPISGQPGPPSLRGVTWKPSRK